MNQIAPEAFVWLGTAAGLFIWDYLESRKFNRRTSDIIEAIHKDIEDFHERLRLIEERHKQK